MIDIYLDIETIPSQSDVYRAKVKAEIKPPANIKKDESKAAWMLEKSEAAVDEKIAKTSFDPAAGHICCISWAVGSEAPWYVEMQSVDQERGMLVDFFHNLNQIEEPGLWRFVGHYVAQFDLRFILCRAIVLGVEIPKYFPRDPKPWDEQVFDTMTAWSGAKGSISLDNLAIALDVGGKGDFDGSMVAEAWSKGQHAVISSYCMSDVALVRAVHEKFKVAGY